jgi:hypothetical protein
VNNMMTFEPATSPVLSTWTVGAVDARRTVPPFAELQGIGLPVGGHSYRKLDRTRLPFAGVGAPLGALGADGVMGVDQVSTAVRIPTAANDSGVPPRRTPPRC